MKKLLYSALCVLLSGYAFGQVNNPLLQPSGGNKAGSTPATQTINGKPVNSNNSGTSTGMGSNSDLNSMLSKNINPNYTWTGLFLGAGATLGFQKNKIETTYQGSTTSREEKTLNYGFSVKGGYFLTPNIAVGTGLNYNGSRTKYPGNNDEDEGSTATSRDFSIAPFVRFANGCSPWDCCRRFGYYVDFSVGVGAGRSKLEYNGSGSSSQVSKNSFFSAGFSPGVIYWPTEKVGIQAGLGSFLTLRSEKDEPYGGQTSTSKTTSTSFNVLDVSSLMPTFGIYYYFNNPQPKGVNQPQY